jgi:hypothetical protein
MILRIEPRMVLTEIYTNMNAVQPQIILVRL